ncbi:MAG: UDP-3-O-(3-hydroxymyristoyl)glucosamine N-acyltransferase [Woeseiaceae bacterium]|nr:UDP-3-O-(3-hydroxymyristoyl)glucosamine N-acyltransferase [Woeseiaceae bacterium]
MAISLGELAVRFGCDLNGDPELVVDHVAPLDSARSGALGFLSNSKLKQQLSSTQATAVILRRDDAADCPVASFIADDPYATYARMAAVLYPVAPLQPGIHQSAVVDETASVAASAQVDANVVIGADSVIGENVRIGPGSVIGPGCRVGDGCRFIANVTLVRSVSIGKRAVIHPGAVIGADGFGNAMTPDGWVKVPQVGGVVVGDDVEIGANTTIDCGAISDTVIGDGVRLDNLCMIAHNVKIGAHTAMAAQCGIAGSAVIGSRCLFAGHSGTVGHVTVCDDVFVGGKAVVTKDINEPGSYAGSFSAEKSQTWNRQVARVRRLDALQERVRKLEKDRK